LGAKDSNSNPYKNIYTLRDTGKQPDFNLFFMWLGVPDFLTGSPAPADYLIINTSIHERQITGIIIVISVLYPV
jgi:hypothetical protein